jgi:Aldehyde dehydrogenase family
MSGPASDLSCNALFIGDEWRKPEDGSIGVVISPSTEEVIATAAQAGEGDIAAAVTAARDAFDGGPWPSMSPADQADVRRPGSVASSARPAPSCSAGPSRCSGRSDPVHSATIKI